MNNKNFGNVLILISMHVLNKGAHDIFFFGLITVLNFLTKPFSYFLDMRIRIDQGPKVSR